MEQSKIGKDKVHSQAYYNTGKIEVIEFIEDQKLSFHLGNAVKYIARAGKKDATRPGQVEDLQKAVWYLNRRIELIKAKHEHRTALRPNEMKP